MPATDIVVDSHQHFWDPSELDVPAPPPEQAVLGRAYLPEDLAPKLARVGVDYTVLVQGHPQTAEGNRWLCRQANATPYVAGVVAWAQLDDPASLSGTLDTLRAEPKFCGIRHIVEAEPDPAWILRDTVLESLRQLAQRNIPYDMLARPKHLPHVLTLLGRLPELRMVIDHIAKPDIAGGGSPGWA